MKIAPRIALLVSSMVAGTALFFVPPSNADIGADHYDDNVKAYGDVYHDYICTTIRTADSENEIKALVYNVMRDGLFNADQTAKTILYSVNVYCPWQMKHLGELIGAVGSPAADAKTHIV